jgi:hypothetical protein
MVSLLLQTKSKKEKPVDGKQKEVSLRITSAAIGGALRKRWSMIWNKPTEELDHLSSPAAS